MQYPFTPSKEQPADEETALSAHPSARTIDQKRYLAETSRVPSTDWKEFFKQHNLPLHKEMVDVRQKLSSNREHKAKNLMQEEITPFSPPASSVKQNNFNYSPKQKDIEISHPPDFFNSPPQKSLF